MYEGRPGSLLPQWGGGAILPLCSPGIFSGEALSRSGQRTPQQIYAFRSNESFVLTCRGALWPLHLQDAS